MFSPVTVVPFPLNAVIFYSLLLDGQFLASYPSYLQLLWIGITPLNSTWAASIYTSWGFGLWHSRMGSVKLTWGSGLALCGPHATQGMRAVAVAITMAWDPLAMGTMTGQGPVAATVGTARAQQQKCGIWWLQAKLATDGSALQGQRA